MKNMHNKNSVTSLSCLTSVFAKSFFPWSTVKFSKFADFWQILLPFWTYLILAIKTYSLPPWTSFDVTYHDFRYRKPLLLSFKKLHFLFSIYPKWTFLTDMSMLINLPSKQEKTPEETLIDFGELFSVSKQSYYFFSREKFFYCHLKIEGTSFTVISDLFIIKWNLSFTSKEVPQGSEYALNKATRA